MTKSRLQITDVPRLLVSVRDADEAAEALSARVDWIDLKDPDAGSLGCPRIYVAQAVGRVLDGFPNRSVAVGELLEVNIDEIKELAMLFPVLKVGFSNCAQPGIDWRSRLQALAALIDSESAIVPVIYADYSECNAPSPDDVLEQIPILRAKWILIDTFNKDGRTLLNWFDVQSLLRIKKQAYSLGAHTVFAGSLTADCIEQIKPINPEVIAVRGAVCDGNRRAPISTNKIRQLQVVLSGRPLDSQNSESQIANVSKPKMPFVDSRSTATGIDT